MKIKARFYSRQGLYFCNFCQIREDVMSLYLFPGPSVEKIAGSKRFLLLSFGIHLFIWRGITIHFVGSRISYSWKSRFIFLILQTFIIIHCAAFRSYVGWHDILGGFMRGRNIFFSNTSTPILNELDTKHILYYQCEMTSSRISKKINLPPH